MLQLSMFHLACFGSSVERPTDELVFQKWLRWILFFIYLHFGYQIYACTCI